MANSVHTARWISQIDDQGWDIHLFPSIDHGMIHPDLRNITIHHSFYGRQKNRGRNVKLHGFPVISELIATIGRRSLTKILPNYRMLQIKRLIKSLRPDIIHSMEIQAAGYLTLEVRQQSVGPFPRWIVTNWGSDIYLFGRLAEHVDKIKAVLEACDYYSCECQRDVHLAKQMGLKGQVLPVLPNAGGYDLARDAQFKHSGPTSTRRLVLLKGYQGLFGRALVGLRAIALCANELQGYRIAIYLAGPEVKIAAELVSQSTGIPIDLISFCSHEDMLRLYGRARVYVGLSISDATSTSLLEAIVMGAFPIQSCTACADEWIVDGETGFIVPPEDPEPIAAAIRRAVSDDALVDRAAEVNAKLAKERIDQAVIRPQVVAMYKKVAGQ
jgi:glycosyltransferase involved in cell wall biosynthesis